MPSDIRLDGELIMAEATDLQLDHPSRRRGANQDKPRRALVHAPDDSLTINWDGDYPGGVDIFGPNAKTKLEIGEDKVVIRFFPDGITLEITPNGITVTSSGSSLLITPSMFSVSNNKAFMGLMGAGDIADLSLSVESVHLKATSTPEGERGGVALSHNPENDTLVLNKGDEFEGGVKIDGNVEVQNYLHAETLNADSIVIGRKDAADPIEKPTIEISPTAIVKTEIIHNFDPRTGHDTSRRRTLDITKEVPRLSEEIRKLQSGEGELRGKKVQAVEELVVGKDESEETAVAPLHPLRREEKYIRIKEDAIELVTRGGLQPVNERVLDLVSEIRKLRQEVDQLKRPSGS